MFGGYGRYNKLQVAVEKYSASTNVWSEIAYMHDDRKRFCACAFTDKVFVIGGCHHEDQHLDSCVQFDTKDCEWKEAVGMNQPRTSAACTVYEGRIVVSGGTNNLDDLNSVESYDVLPNRWSIMPSMITAKSS